MDTYVCLLCQKPAENVHVIKYDNKFTNDKWAESIDTLGEQLLDNSTPTNTVNIIRNKLYSWRIITPNKPTSISPSLSVVILVHTLIGWQAFM